MRGNIVQPQKPGTDLDGIVLSETGESRKTNTIGSPLYVEYSENKPLHPPESEKK